MLRRTIHAIKSFFSRAMRIGAVAHFSGHAFTRLARYLLAKNFQPDTIMEFGAGMGTMTRHIIHQRPESMVKAFEIDDERFDTLQQYAWPLLECIHTSCLDARDHHPAGQKVSLVISTLPLSLFSVVDRDALLETVHDILTDDGLFVQFQYSRLNEKDIQRHLDIIDRLYEWRNIPPSYIFIAKKKWNISH